MPPVFLSGQVDRLILEDMDPHGQFTGWNDARGFGFIIPDKGGEACVHINALVSGPIRSVDGALLVFQTRNGSRGRRQGDQGRSRPSEKRTAPRMPRSGRPLPLGPALAVLFLFCLAFSVGTGRLPLALACAYAAMSLATFLAYAKDKHSAVRGRWRIPEKTLHLLEFAGGWPGAAFAQQIFRHKTVKAEYQAGFLAIVLLHCAAFGWVLFTKQGGDFAWMAFGPATHKILLLLGLHIQ